eukprot:COSAG02_NODE_605_length_19635_cov_7.106982_1_plen_157_part_00
MQPCQLSESEPTTAAFSLGRCRCWPSRLLQEAWLSHAADPTALYGASLVCHSGCHTHARKRAGVRADRGSSWPLRLAASVPPSRTVSGACAHGEAHWCALASTLRVRLRCRVPASHAHTASLPQARCCCTGQEHGASALPQIQARCRTHICLEPSA